MKYPAYPQYKDSGVAWLGEVPTDWEVKRLKYLASINDSALPESTNPDFEFSYIDIGSVNLVEGITATESMIFENAPSRARRVVQAGDIIVSTVRTYLRAIASISQSDETLIVSTGFAVIRPRRIESKFLNYALKESSFVENVVSRSVGVSYPAVNAREIGDIQILAPSETEQTAIANFLDRETGRIDTLVAKKRKLVELLKEKRSALISRTVTRALPADAAREFDLEPHMSFKQSGVEWLGEIPTRWGVTALRYAFQNHDYRRIPIAGVDRADMDKIYPYYGASGVIDYVENFIFDETLILVAEDGANLLSRSTPLAFIASGKYWVNNHAHILKPISGDIRYWVGLLQTFDYTPLITGAAQPKLTADRLGGIVLPKPPEEEQTAIATYLDRETAKIDRLVAKVDTAIARLQEYRSALITSAVTGKIDIRRNLND